MEQSRFKSPVGSFYLRGLFFEETGADKSTVLYTLKREDHLGYLSLYRLYMESQDPTEYHFAVSHLYGWDHWEILQECTWFKAHIAQWRRELEAKIRAEALVNIRVLADTEKPTSFQANKYLLDGSWKGTDVSKRGKGRPTKADIQNAAGELARASQEAKDDYERIMGKVQ